VTAHSPSPDNEAGPQLVAFPEYAAHPGDADVEQWRTRIVGVGYEDPEQIMANPLNWRVHPQSQQAAMKGILRSIGWVDTVIINRTTLFLVNGHMRVQIALSERQRRIPVQYVELTEAEEAAVLKTFDAIGLLAVRDPRLDEELMAAVAERDASLVDIVAAVARDRAATSFLDGLIAGEGDADPDRMTEAQRIAAAAAQLAGDDTGDDPHDDDDGWTDAHNGPQSDSAGREDGFTPDPVSMDTAPADTTMIPLTFNVSATDRATVMRVLKDIAAVRGLHSAAAALVWLCARHSPADSSVDLRPVHVGEPITPHPVPLTLDPTVQVEEAQQRVVDGVTGEQYIAVTVVNAHPAPDALFDDEDHKDQWDD